MRDARPTSNHRTRRRVFATAATTVALAAFVSIPVAGADTPQACTLEPAADAMPLGPQLADTVRETSVGEAVLHRLDCPVAATKWIWLRISPGAVPTVVAWSDLQRPGLRSGS